MNANLRSPLGRVLGLGAAHDGVGHWWLQRLSALALIPLSVWFVVSLLSLPVLDHATAVAWMRQGSSALLLALFLLCAVWHSQLGLRVIVEDYVHGKGTRTVTLVALTFAHVLLAAAGLFAILKVAIGAPA
ncbi:MAG: succinate dehydrogenase, hydrophobic membrane anchor protein [Proteobacteria bacterium]|nr:succinate dehydrogenase, hydrophobic membrane anchor protein [Pseudomonadota bacterium]